MTKILITRPEHQARTTIKALDEAGLSTFADPLLHLKEIPHAVDDYASYEAFIVTSGNSFSFWDMTGVDKDKPLIAVGSQTARLAAEHGFTSITDINGTARNIQDHLNGEKALHVGGYHISHSLGDHVERLIVYEAVPAEELSAACKQALERGEIELAMFYSTRTAKIFVRLIQAAELEHRLEAVKVLSMSANVIRSVRVLPWADMYKSSMPNGTAMIDACKRIMNDEYEPA